MSSPSTPPRGRPSRIDRAHTVRTALDLLDQSGLDALTMRRLAGAMGVQAGALYRYYATKQELLTAMSEQMMEGVAQTAADGDTPWNERLSALAHALRNALLAHRDGARVFAGTHSTGAGVLGFADTLVGVLREAGFSGDDAARTLYTVANFTVGHTLEEQAATAPENGDPAGPERLRSAVTSGSDYPHLKDTLPALASTDFARNFEFGLSLLIEGLRARR
ncbi:TetR/AcrR family transcriptional regulator [Streptomyces sp. NPDC059900]|uniref:TetR/AcrR family transcriptional regulator n=1 Tax=Streptomyces sp. NPDC059900 TaxID=3155816 RepID=UPI0034232DA7